MTDKTMKYTFCPVETLRWHLPPEPVLCPWAQSLRSNWWSHGPVLCAPHWIGPRHHCSTLGENCVEMPYRTRA
jgi:hypothetical protein